MSHDQVKVRTIRPHDTITGMRAPGEEYERTKADAERLAKAGVVEVIGTKAAKAK
jgi:hypothetical protein